MTKQDEYVEWMDHRIGPLEKYVQDFWSGKIDHTPENMAAEFAKSAKLEAYREAKRLYLELHGGKDE